MDDCQNKWHQVVVDTACDEPRGKKDSKKESKGCKEASGGVGKATAEKSPRKEGTALDVLIVVGKAKYIGEK